MEVEGAFEKKYKDEMVTNEGKKLDFIILYGTDGKGSCLLYTSRSLGVMWDNYKKTLGTAPYLGRQKFGTRKQGSLDLRSVSYTHLNQPVVKTSVIGRVDIYTTLN